MKDGRFVDMEGGEVKINYEIVEFFLELNIGRVILEDEMVFGKIYKLCIDMKNYGDVMVNGDDWVIKCKIWLLKFFNYRFFRGVFDIEFDGIDMKLGEFKYVNGSIKVFKVFGEIFIWL